MIPTHEHEYEYETQLLRIVGERLLPSPGLRDPALRAVALALLREAYLAASAKQRGQLRRAADLRDAPKPQTCKVVPAWLLALVLKLLGNAGLHRWASLHHPGALAALGTRGRLAGWLAKPPLTPTADELAAGLRAGLKIATAHDIQTIDARLGQHLRRLTMSLYDFDPRAFPAGVDKPTLIATVKAELSGTVPNLKDSMTNFVLGGLSLDGIIPQGTALQIEHVRKLRFESENRTPSITGTSILNRDAFELIATQLEALRPAPQPGGTISAYVEEFTFVARRLIGNAFQIPIDANGLRERVAIALNEYVPGQSGGTLTLPALDAPETAGSDLVADNIRAVALVYAAWNLEELKLFQVLDRVTEIFMIGQLPVGFDNGGRALSDYYFEDHDQKLSEAARRMTYTRVLGVPGGEVSQEAPPNRAFQDLFLRFLSTVSEFDRQRRIADVFGGRSRFDTLSLTGEQARKSGRDLAANMTLYGYGGTFFVAQRLKAQIEQALRVLSIPEILAAYGVQSPFQVIERVIASDGGAVPNITRCKTMAETGKEILDIVGASIPAWLGLSGNDLFTDPNDNPDEGTGPDIPLATQLRLTRAVEGWLAVNGIKDEQRARLGEPELTAPAPSIPNAGADGAGGAAFDQLRSLVSSGQAPSLDQLKALLPDMNGAARL